MEQRDDLKEEMAVKNLLPILVIRIDSEEKADIEARAKRHTRKWYSDDEREHVKDSAWRIRGDLGEYAFEHYLIQQNILQAHAEHYAYRGNTKPDFVVMKNKEIITIGIKTGRHRIMAESEEPAIPYTVKSEQKLTDYVVALSVLSIPDGSNIAFWGILDKRQIMDAYKSLTIYEGTRGKQNRFVRIPLERFFREQRLFRQLIASLDREVNMNDYQKQKLVNRIEHLGQLKGVSQKEISQKIGCNPRLFYMWCEMKRKPGDEYCQKMPEVIEELEALPTIITESIRQEVLGYLRLQQKMTNEEIADLNDLTVEQVNAIERNERV